MKCPDCKTKRMVLANGYYYCEDCGLEIEEVYD